MNHAAIAAAGLVAAITMTGHPAQAQESATCTTGAESPWDMSPAQIEDFYACMEGKMARGYAAKGDEVAANYRDWTVSSTRPAVQGAHSARLLQTFANDVAAEQYLEFESEGVEMPAGSVLAKESFSVKDGAGVVGPLFIMTKLEAGASPETADWRYDALTGSGDKMGVSQAFCHDCHVTWESQDMMAYPIEEVRVSQ